MCGLICTVALQIGYARRHCDVAGVVYPKSFPGAAGDTTIVLEGVDGGRSCANASEVSCSRKKKKKENVEEPVPSARDAARCGGIYGAATTHHDLTKTCRSSSARKRQRRRARQAIHGTQSVAAARRPCASFRGLLSAVFHAAWGRRWHGALMGPRRLEYGDGTTSDMIVTRQGTHCGLLCCACERHAAEAASPGHTGPGASGLRAYQSRGGGDWTDEACLLRCQRCRAADERRPQQPLAHTESASTAGKRSLARAVFGQCAS